MWASFDVSSLPSVPAALWKVPSLHISDSKVNAYLPFFVVHLDFALNSVWPSLSPRICPSWPLARNAALLLPPLRSDVRPRIRPSIGPSVRRKMTRNLVGFCRAASFLHSFVPSFLPSLLQRIPTVCPSASVSAAALRPLFSMRPLTHTEWKFSSTLGPLFDFSTRSLPY